MGRICGNLYCSRVPTAMCSGRCLRNAWSAPAHAVVGPEVGRFGQRVLQVPVAGLDDVATAVVAATSDLGQPPEDRPFHGHLTLARAQPRRHGRSVRVDLRPLAGALVAGEWPVDAVCLVESRLHPHGARYEVLEKFRLGP